MSERHSLDADGVSYLNIVDRCLRGDWHALVNGYWSPGYPFLLTLWFKVFHPSAYYTPLSVRLFGVFTLLLAAAAFEYFLNAFFLFQKEYLGNTDSHPANLSSGIVRWFALGLFLWLTISLTPSTLDQPDVLVFAIYLVASAASIHVALRPSAKRLLFLGVLLGFAYLIKVVMLPIGISFLVALLFYRRTRKVGWKLALTPLALVAVALPFMLLLSKAKGRWTYGDAGSFNYEHVINESDDLPAATDRSSAALRVEVYSDRLALGTYPPWADPSFGYQNHLHRLHIRRQLNITHIVLTYYFELFAIQLGCLMCGLLALVLSSQCSLATFCSRSWRQAVLWLPAVAGLCLYALVRVQGRFLAGFIVGLFAAALGAIEFGRDAGSQKSANRIVAATLVLLLLQAGFAVGHFAIHALSASYPDWEVVTALRGMGVKPGERVSYLGDALSDHVWAYLGRYQIVGEIPDDDVAAFWAATDTARSCALSRLTEAGARVLVTRRVPKTAIAQGWEHINTTEYYALRVSSGGGTGSAPSPACGGFVPVQ